MPLEESPEAFFEAFQGHAARLNALPNPVGYPLLTLETPLGPLEVFDRGLPLGEGGPVQVLIHGVVARFWPGEGDLLEPLQGGRHRLGGRVTKDLDGGFYRFELAGVPLVLFSPEPLAGSLLVETAPVLMGFRP